MMTTAPTYCEDSAGVKSICDSKNFGRNAAKAARTKPSADAQTPTRTHTGFWKRVQRSAVNCFGGRMGGYRRIEE
jgi:hypothetical protein